MVVDDASPQGSSYPGSNDPVNPTSQSSVSQNPAMASNFHLVVKPELVVRPDAFTKLFGFYGNYNWERHVAYALMERVENTWVMAGRSPTQDEFDAFTTQATRALYYRKMGLPISSFLGTAYLYNATRKTAKLPTTAGPQEVFKFLRNYAVTDKAGFRGWISSSAFKLLFISMTGSIATSFWALWTEAQVALQDPRLKEFVEDMRRQKPEDVRKRKMQAASERVRRVRDGERDMRGQVVAEIEHPGSHAQDGDQDPYASSNAISATASSDNDTSYGTAQTYEQSESASAQRPGPEAPRRPWGYSAQSAPQQPSNESSSGTDFFFGGSNDDDASPTAPEYRNTNPDGSPIGNAWERLRRQNGIQSSPPAQPQWGQSQGYAESPTYTPSGDRDRYDHGRRSEKEQAQADFDRMMEAERNAAAEASPPRRGW
ncbi:hypothetical protein N7462_004838 [Penicillium macrosclerotiorum]|uniref:uncharacterized protein n=1 Tax=Penicillium macrosclerotiorum TaxID=303699 RepID=UPI0025472D74|nr:uncharacterized protein N7462_004838 [Penicillium macrosclerotiorum]KAJ5690446.1 hypothetical protein N7462_004838 [Penicillium macrosclerotiorum]